MRVPPIFVGAMITILSAALALSALAGQYNVPSDFPTIQAAVAAAEVSADIDNFINLTNPVVFATAEIVIDSDFSCTRKLTIRPHPTLWRATVASTDGTEPIFTLTDAGCVTFQDLDIVRSTTNSNDLIHMSYGGVGNNDILFERCRIGSVWEGLGSRSWSYLVIWSPYRVVVRNCIFFAYTRGDFDRGILADGLTEPDHALYLYNNLVADYAQRGISIPAAGAGLIVLRNNIVVNHPDFPPGAEPYAYHSGIDAEEPIIETSHNVGFASDGHEEELAVGARTIAGGPGATNEYFIRYDRPAVDDAFVTRTWITDPPWDPNDDFFDLDWEGILHEVDSWGVTVETGSPAAGDIAVVDDIDREVRPSGVPEHTDRGADQVDAYIAGIPCRPEAKPLWAEPVDNPSSTISIMFGSGRAGLLRFEVFDVIGRLLYRSERAVRAGEAGKLEWPGPATSAVLLYRLRLVREDGPAAEVQGKVVLVR